MMSLPKSIVLLAALLIALGAGQATAQTLDQLTEIQQLQAELKRDRQAVVAANLPLTDAESSAFWPVYKEYRAEAEKIGGRLARLITAYGANFTTMDNTKADAFLTELLAVDRERLTVREKYAPRLRAVLPATKAARFFQIENKLDAAVSLSLAVEIPLVPLKK